jgi:hypothetical protein
VPLKCSLSEADYESDVLLVRLDTTWIEAYQTSKREFFYYDNYLLLLLSMPAIGLFGYHAFTRFPVGKRVWQLCVLLCSMTIMCVTVNILTFCPSKMLTLVMKPLTSPHTTTLSFITDGEAKYGLLPVKIHFVVPVTVQSAAIDPPNVAMSMVSSLQMQGKTNTAPASKFLNHIQLPSCEKVVFLLYKF